MEYLLRSIHKARSLQWLFGASLFVGLHFFAVHYIDSSFLSGFIPENRVGLLYGTASLLAAFVLLSIPRFLHSFGYARVLLSATLLDIAATFGLAFLHNPGLLAVCFTLITILVPIILFTLDVYLEQKSPDKAEEGNVRGIYLSMGTLAALLAPYLAGVVAGADAHYERVYFVSGLFLLPFLVIVYARLRDVVDPVYHDFSPMRTLRTVLVDSNVRNIATAQFLMRLYFAWMVVYLPIYLHSHIGFSWPEIGVVLFIMLVPYLLIEWPAGIIADNWLGEKELLAAGFFITALSTVALAFLATPSIALWGGVLFITRIGTALIESMTETYFFKKVDGSRPDLISFFRVLRPLAYAVGPVLATLTLVFTSVTYLWVVLGAIMLIGMLHARALEDTK